MKRLLLTAGLGLLALTGRAQQYQSPLPLDSVTHKVTYQAVVEAPGVTAAELLRRARVWADKLSPGAAVGEDSRVTAHGVTTVPLRGGGQRKLLYAATIEARAGRYRYEITNLENKTDAVTVVVGGYGATAQGGQSPIERMFVYDGNFDRKGRPRASLTDYLTSVNEHIRSVEKDLQRAMLVAAKDW